jgi:hypothetical protein
VLHAARPRDYDVGTPVLFVHHGVGRNDRDYRDYWLNLVDEALIRPMILNQGPDASNFEMSTAVAAGRHCWRDQTFVPATPRTS